MEKLLGSLFRHGLTAAGAVLINNGIVDQAGALKIADLADVLAGATIALLGIAWSWWNKRKTA